MQKLSVFVQAKMPPGLLSLLGNSGYERQEESYLLKPSGSTPSFGGGGAVNYSSSGSTQQVKRVSSANEFTATSVDGVQLGSGLDETSRENLGRSPSGDFSDADLYSLNSKARINQIDEWQAAWNVTNAIQVGCLSKKKGNLYSY